MAATLERELRRRFDAVGGQYRLDIHVSGESFLTPPGELSALIERAIYQETGMTPELSTSGGTSDARYFRTTARWPSSACSTRPSTSRTNRSPSRT
jgi:acetylornithine deacetylase/succinyl-diaminopimelate desuccinylase-like protein